MWRSFLSVCLVCVGVMQKVGGSHRGGTGCAEVEEPLCGSSYPVMLHQQKKKKRLMSPQRCSVLKNISIMVFYILINAMVALKFMSGHCAPGALARLLLVGCTPEGTSSLPLVSMSHTADTSSWPVKLPLETKQTKKTFA